MTSEEIKETIRVDYQFLCDCAGVEFDEKEFNRMVEVNSERLDEHLEEHGEISEFQYK